MDDLVGKTVEKCRDKGTMLMVISDHGFGPFRTGVDLNRWLEENGYLMVDDARRGEEHLAGVDWSRTRAFAIGLAGIFIKLEGQVFAGNRRIRRRGGPPARRDRRTPWRRLSTRRVGKAPSSECTSPASSTKVPTRTMQRT